MEFQVENLTIKIFPSNDLYSLQKLSEDSKDYTKLIEGRPPKPTDAEELLKALPEGKSLKDKFVLGVYERDALVGVIDLIKDYPEENIWFIGLLLLSPEYRGKGLGSKIYAQLKQELVTHNSAKAIRISVAEQNTKAINFWRKVGFKDLYSKSETRGNVEMKFIYLEDRF